MQQGLTTERWDLHEEDREGAARRAGKSEAALEQQSRGSAEAPLKFEQEKRRATSVPEGFLDDEDPEQQLAATRLQSQYACARQERSTMSTEIG